MSHAARVSALLLIALLSACDRPVTPPVAAPAPLPRPVVTLAAGSSPVWIPQAALTERGGLPGVFVLSAEQTARFRLLRTGKHGGGRIEVLSGLHGNETLILGDLDTVHDGSPIQTR